MSPHPLRCLPLPFLAAALAAALSTAPAHAAPPLVTIVPFVASNPSHPHRTWSGRVVWMKAVTDVQGADYEYTWDFGDGMTSTATVADRYVITAQYSYSGAVGTVYNATITVRNTVTGEQASVPYPVEIRERTLDLEVQVARDEGLWYLHRVMNRYTPAGKPGSGTWYGVRVGTEWAYDPAITPAVLTAFEVNGYLATGDPGHPYTDTVKRGFHGMWGSLYTVAIAAQTNGIGAFDPDVLPNGIAVRGYWDNTHMSGTAFFIEAIVASGTPAAVVPTTTGIRDGVAGRTYADLVQDMVDYYSYCQYDTAPQGGGWGGSCNGTPYHSTSQFAAIALLAAKGFGGVTVPNIVRQWNATWLAYTQDGVTGGFGSSDATGVDVRYTAGAMVQMALDGVGRGNAAWDRAETYMRDRFVNATIYPPQVTRDYYYLPAFVKALRLHDSNNDGVAEPIVLLQSLTAGVSSVNWYGARVSNSDMVTGVAGAVVDYQDSYIGYWTARSSSNTWYPFDTSWAICMLTTLPPSIATVAPSSGPTSGGTLVTVTGGTFTPPASVAFDSSWGTATVVVDSKTIQVRTPAHAAGAVGIRVRVADGQEATLPAAYTYTSAGPPAPVFTDDPLLPGATTVKAVHVTELRQSVDDLRARFGLGTFAWTDSPLAPGAAVRAIHLVDLRAALAAAYVAAGRSAPTYTDTPIAAGATPVRAVHVAELRAAVLALW
jgi:hypothetical protein